MIFEYFLLDNAYQKNCSAHDGTTRIWSMYICISMNFYWFSNCCLWILSFHRGFQYVPFVWIWPFVDRESFPLLLVAFFPTRQTRFACMWILAQAMESWIVKLVRQLYNNNYTMATANAPRTRIWKIEIIIDA